MLAYQLMVYLPSSPFIAALLLLLIAVTAWKILRWAWDTVNPLKWLL